MGTSGRKRRRRQAADQTALMRLQVRIARCADRLARGERSRPPRTLTEDMQLWMRAEYTILNANAG
jgi:hypothetical protein